MTTGRLHLERVNTSARRMSQLVDDLLNFSRVTRAGDAPGARWI